MIRKTGLMKAGRQRSLLVCLAAGLLAAGVAGQVAGLEVPLSVREPAGVERRAEPVTGGVSFAPGDVPDAAGLVLVDAVGKPVPAQFTVLLTHADGSVRWVLVDALADVPAGEETRFTLKTGGGSPAPAKPLVIEESDTNIKVNTGIISFTVNKTAFGLFDQVEVGGRKVVEGGTVEARTAEMEKKDLGKKGSSPEVFLAWPS